LNQVLIILGDFRQCLPVVPRASRAQITASTISNAVFWKDVVQLNLYVNMRLLSQAGQMTPDRLQYARTFAKWLLHIGNGKGCQNSLEVSLPECKLAINIFSFLE
jgi:PIF1-like helicase